MANKYTEQEKEQAKLVHEKIRSILIKYGNVEYGDCIIDEISEAVGIPTTIIYYAEQSISKAIGNYHLGGVLHEDLFEHPDKIPATVRKVLEHYWSKYGEDMDYRHTADMQKQVEAVGYTFDYYLDNVPYGLRPLSVQIHELRGYEK